MACMLRGLWIFHAECEVRLIMSRRFPTVERRMQKLLGDDYVSLPNDEDIQSMFIQEVLHEEEDHYIPPGISEPFHEDFQQGSFAWNAEQEGHAEKLWPMGPISSILQGKIWPLLFMFKKGYYLVTVVGLERKYKLDQVRALELPQVTAAFAVLEDIFDFIPSTLSIADVAGISELQYYIRSAIPFGSPTNTNFHLLKMVRHGFPNRVEEEGAQRSPAWKPYLYKGKAKVRLSIIEAVNCMLYGKPEYEDDCFISGTIYCCADISGVPEIIVPISYNGRQGSGTKPQPPPEISVHNSAQIVGDIRAARSPDSLKISCTPPTGPFVLCRYRYAVSPLVPIRGHFHLKEMSPVEFRLLIQVEFHPLIQSAAWSCQVRLPFHHRGLIKSHDLKCSGGSISVTDQGHSILWNLNMRRARNHAEINLLGELIFEAATTTTTSGIGSSAASGGSGGGVGAGSSSNHQLVRGTGTEAPRVTNAGAPQLGVGGTLMVNRNGNAVIIGSSLTPTGGLMYAHPSSVVPARDPFGAEGRLRAGSSSGAAVGSGSGARSSGTEAFSSILGDFGSSGGHRGADGGGEGGGGGVGGGGDDPGQESGGKQGGGASSTSQPLGRVQDPFLRGVSCYAEVFLEVPDTTLSGIFVDPKAVTVYPATKANSSVSVHREVNTGKYIIWNTAGQVRGHRGNLEFDKDDGGAICSSGALLPPATFVGQTRHVIASASS